MFLPKVFPILAESTAKSTRKKFICSKFSSAHVVDCRFDNIKHQSTIFEKKLLGVEWLKKIPVLNRHLNSLRHLLKNMKAKSSTQMGHSRRFFYPKFANCLHATSASMFTLLKVKLFFDQIIANLP